MKLSIVSFALAVSVVGGFTAPIGSSTAATSSRSTVTSSTSVVNMSTAPTQAAPFAKGDR